MKYIFLFTILYPVILTGDAVVSRKINSAILSAVVVQDEKKPAGARTELNRAIAQGLTDLDYEIGYNKNGILSLRFYITIEAAYPWSSQVCLNFDVRTGRFLRIKDVIAKGMLERFKRKVMADKLDSLKRDKPEDSTAMFIIADCMERVDLEHFYIDTAGLEILDPCEFPHVMKNEEPLYQLKYPYSFLSPYLRPEFRRRLGSARQIPP